MANPKRRDEKLDKLNGKRTLTAGQLEKAYTRLARSFSRFRKLNKEMKRLDRAITERLVELSKESKKANGKPPAPIAAGIPDINQDRAEPDSPGSGGTV